MTTQWKEQTHLSAGTITGKLLRANEVERKHQRTKGLTSIEHDNKTKKLGHPNDDKHLKWTRSKTEHNVSTQKQNETLRDKKQNVGEDSSNTDSTSTGE